MIRPAAETFSVRVTGALVTVAVLLAGVFVLLSAYGDRARETGDGGPHGLSRAATGFSGLVALAPAAGMDARISRSDRSGSAGLLVLTPPIDADPAKIATLVKRRDGDPVLLILPKWLTLPLPARPSWVQTAAKVPADRVAALLKAIAPTAGVLDADTPPARLAGTGDADGLRFAVPGETRVITGKELVEVVVTDKGAMVMGWLPNRNLYILADPDLLDNHGLRTVDRARTALALLNKLGGDHPGGLIFDVTLNGFGHGQNLLRLAVEPPFLSMTLALLIAAGLALWQGSARFGTPAPAARAIAFGKRALVDNAAALIRMARREPALAERYAIQIRDAAATTLGAPAGLQGAALAEWLDRRGNGARFADLAYEAALATDRALALAAARALYQWQQDVTHDPR